MKIGDRVKYSDLGVNTAAERFPETAEVLRRYLRRRRGTVIEILAEGAQVDWDDDASVPSCFYPTATFKFLQEAK